MKLVSATPFLLLAAAAADARAEDCVAPADLSPSEVTLRKSVGFVDVAPDAAKACKLCAFFTDDKGACGLCQILGGAVSPLSHCNSWAAHS